MAVSPPLWLNDNFLEKALRSEGNDPSISVITSEIKPATAAGDNFASDMFRASLKIRRKEKIQEVSLIIKTLPSAAEMAKVIDESPSFAKETQYFSVIMPAQQSLINETYSAKYFYSTTKPKSIVLEDLKKSGFKMADVSLGLDLKHTLLVLKTLARFHATSHVLYQSNQHYFDEYLTSKQTDEQNMPMKTFLHTNVPCLAEEVQKWEEFKEKYYKPLLSLADTSFELWLRCYKRDEHGFNVLAHADLWFNNIMFKYSEESGEVEDVRFVDFQMCYWTSPALDLHYFINSSVCPSVLEHFDMLIKEYHHTLSDTLSRLGHKNVLPTLQVLQDEVEKRNKLGLLSAIAIRNLALKDKTRVPDLNKVLRNEGGIYYSDHYKQSLKQLLPLYEKWGWINNN